MLLAYLSSMHVGDEPQGVACNPMSPETPYVHVTSFAGNLSTVDAFEGFSLPTWNGLQHARQTLKRHCRVQSRTH